ncbi:chromate resistance protein ChrB domain-containing protein [Spirosoma flavum]|uniref:Chromate resistance protein ChrB domain-containing protein n=1 Tax=Spirosoma flavum TaxID=2048557 RepID=A0ABW6AJL3_9BACT
MNWITRERPKIDRLACPWLIKQFIDPQAIFFSFRKIRYSTRHKLWTPFRLMCRVSNIPISRTVCTFDYFLQKHALTDPALQTIAPIVRGADTDDHTVAAQTAGL